jgi:hypothetical protein
LQLRTSRVAHAEGGVINDPHSTLHDQVLDTVLRGPGLSEAGIRAAAAQGSGVPTDLKSLIDKIHRHAYKVTDEDVARAAAKYGQDEMFEFIVSAALGAAEKRLRIGLSVLDRA